MKTKTKIVLRNGAISIVVLYLLFILFDNVVMPYYVQQGKVTKVPNVIGMTLLDAKNALKSAGLIPKEAEHKKDSHYPEGTVILQNPLENAEVKYGRGVYLTISGGEALITVPNIKGKSIRDASFDLERFGLKLGSVQYEPSEEYFENTIMRQDPAAGAKVGNDAIIQVTLSQGRNANKQAVPSVTLKTYTEAEKLLTQAGFKVGVVTYQISLDLLPNTIIEQYPHGGELATKGQNIDLIVAQKSEKIITKEN